jgi:hypothetical protein
MKGLGRKLSPRALHQCTLFARQSRRECTACVRHLSPHLEDGLYIISHAVSAREPWGGNKTHDPTEEPEIEMLG